MKRIFFRTFALPVAVAITMMTFTSCSDDDSKAQEPAPEGGYSIPVTIEISQAADHTASTRVSFDEESGLLTFTADDKLFIEGTETTAGKFAGTLDYISSTADAAIFEGELFVTNAYTASADVLLAAASQGTNHVTATLLPEGYSSHGYLSVSGTKCAATLNIDGTKAIAVGDMTLGVEQFAHEFATVYDSNEGFSLAEKNAVVSFLISDLTSTFTADNVTVKLADASTTYINKTIPTSNSFVLALPSAAYTALKLTVSDGTTVSTIELGDVTFMAGSVYKEVRAIDDSKLVDLAKVTTDIELANGSLVSGTLANPVKVTIADGAAVTLSDAIIIGINDNGKYKWAGITCAGDATINLDGTNLVRGFNERYPGILPAADKTLTIQSTSGQGKLIASSNGQACGIGGGESNSCGTIVISGGIIEATGGDSSAGIGAGWADEHQTASCESVLITGGTVKATGGKNAAGIGTGYAYGGAVSTCGSISIKGGTVTAIGGALAAGIGTGFAEEYGNSVCASLTITSRAEKIVAVKGAGGAQSQCIGHGTEDGSSNSGIYYYDPESLDWEAGTFTIDGNKKWKAGTDTQNFKWTVSKTIYDDDTWTLTRKK